MKCALLIALAFVACRKDDPPQPIYPGTPAIAAPTLAAPEDCAEGVSNPITFQWTAVPGATSYTLRCLIPENSPSGWLWILADDTAYTYTSPIQAHAMGKEVHWDVRANTSANTGPWSDSRTFTLAP